MAALDALMRMRAAAVALALLVPAVPAAVAGQETLAGPPLPTAARVAPAVAEPRVGDGERTVSGLPRNLLLGIGGVFHRDNVVPLLAGAGAAGAASLADGTVQRSLSNRHSGFGRAGETGGGPLVSGALTVGLFAWGRLDRDHPRWRDATYDMLDATIVNGLYSQALKLAAGRERPDGSNSRSFPSGHTSNAFALATCVERHYGWRVSLPAYALASAVAVSRLQRDKHHLSDVVAGAALGYVVGRTVARVNGRPHPQERRASWQMTPLLLPRGAGIEVVGTF